MRLSFVSGPKARCSNDGAWRGLRLRAGLHCGVTKQTVHSVSQKTTYSGSVLDTARMIGDAGQGGQTLLSAQAWAKAQLNGQNLDVSPIHMGTYRLSNEETVQFVQVLPAMLSSKRDMSSQPFRTCTKVMPG